MVQTPDGGGYSAVINKYTEALMPYIEPEAVVTKVDNSSTLVKVAYKTGGIVMIILAKKVLVTLPLVVLKAGRYNSFFI